MLEVLRDAVLLAGVGSISFGLWQIYPPASWIFSGAVIAALAIAIARSAPK